MSQWTHVLFVAEVITTERLSKQILKEQVEQTALKYGEVISGSEGGCDVFVNIPSYHNAVLLTDRDDEYRWSNAYITICGHLRDRTVEETGDDIEWVVKRIKQDFTGVRNITYDVLSDGNELHYWRNQDKEN